MWGTAMTYAPAAQVLEAGGAQSNGGSSHIKPLRLVHV